MLERPTLYPVVPAKSVKAIDVNDGKADIDLWSLLRERYNFNSTYRRFTLENLFSDSSSSVVNDAGYPFLHSNRVSILGKCG